MPVCSRCFGIYFALFISLIFLFILSPVFSKIEVLILFVLLNLPLIIDGTVQYLKLRESNNRFRVFTGILAGIGAGIAIYYLFEIFI